LRACTSMVSAIAFAGSWNRDFSWFGWWSFRLYWQPSCWRI
jgi:hypothetical protein